MYFHFTWRVYTIFIWDTRQIVISPKFDDFFFFKARKIDQLLPNNLINKEGMRGECCRRNNYKRDSLYNWEVQLY